MSGLVVDILQTAFGSPKKHNKDRGQISFDCPACGDDKGMPEGDGKGNLEVNYNKGIYHCWACGDHNNMRGVIPKLLKRYGTPKQLKDYLILKPEFVQQESGNETIVVGLPEGFIPLSNKGNDQGYQMAMSYLKKRNIGEDIIKYHNIGYATRGQYKNRVIIPSYDDAGHINYYVGRSYDKYTKPKYLNPLAEKENVIFNEQKINWDSTIYLVEGPFDHIVIPNSIPLLGKILFDKLLDMIYRKAKGYVVIVLDDDAKVDAMKLYVKLNFGDLFGRIKICTPPKKYDPAKIYERLGNGGIVKLLKNSTTIPESRL